MLEITMAMPEYTETTILHLYNVWTRFKFLSWNGDYIESCSKAWQWMRYCHAGHRRANQQIPLIAVFDVVGKKNKANTTSTVTEYANHCCDDRFNSFFEEEDNLEIKN